MDYLLLIDDDPGPTPEQVRQAFSAPRYPRPRRGSGRYTIEAEIHDGPYNRIKNWDYAALMTAFNADDGKGLGLRAATVGAFDAAMDRALAHDGPCLIEVPIDPHDCSRELREWGSRVAAANGRAPRLTGLRLQEV